VNKNVSHINFDFSFSVDFQEIFEHKLAHLFITLFGLRRLHGPLPRLGVSWIRTSSARTVSTDTRVSSSPLCLLSSASPTGLSTLTSATRRWPKNCCDMGIAYISDLCITLATAGKWRPNCSAGNYWIVRYLRHFLPVNIIILCGKCLKCLTIQCWRPSAEKCKQWTNRSILKDFCEDYVWDFVYSYSLRLGVCTFIFTARQ